MKIQQPYNPFDAYTSFDTKHKAIITMRDGRAYEFTIEEIRSLKDQCDKIIDEYDLDRPHLGPTNRQLRSNEALNNAWSEFLVIQKLTGTKQ